MSPINTCMRLLAICLLPALSACGSGSASPAEREIVALGLAGPYYTNSALLSVELELNGSAMEGELPGGLAPQAQVSVDRGMLLRPEGLHGPAAIGSSFAVDERDWIYWLLPEIEGLAHITAGTERRTESQQISVARSSDVPARIDFRLHPPRLTAKDYLVEIEPLFEYLPGPPGCLERPYGMLGYPEFTFHVITGRLWHTVPLVQDWPNDEPNYLPVNHLPSAAALRSGGIVRWRPYEHAGERPPQDTSLLVVMQWGDLTAARLLEVDATEH